jgi:beta-glucosidase
MTGPDGTEPAAAGPTPHPATPDPGSPGPAATDTAGTDPAGERVETFLAELTLVEKLRLLGGADFWHTNAIERVGIPALHLSDGPSGVRGERSVGTTSVAFPCGAAIGATFDVEAASRLGAALADESLDRGVHVLLGPTVNLHRHPLGGRHFESYSEDPVLSARLAVAYVKALQAGGVAATVKHFVANDTEFERHTISSDVAERVLRELYHVPFEATVTEAGAWAIMSSYNKVNGTYAAEHKGLLASTLRAEWGFDGVVVSDWFGARSTVLSALAGLDLEMPGPPIHYGDALGHAVEAGEVPKTVIDEHVRRLLRLMIRTGALSPGTTPARRRTPTSTIAERQAIARELVSSSFVLLQNEGNLLPFGLHSGQTLAVIGPNAASTAGQGGGSARVNPQQQRSVLDALRDRLEPAGIHVVHERGCVTWVGTPPLEGEFRLEYYNGSGFDSEDFDGRVRHTDAARVGSFTWLGDPAPPDSGLRAGAWVLRAHITLVPEDAGSWTFSLTQVGKARLMVDGETVVDARGELGKGKGFFGLASENLSAAADLEAGRSYEIVVEYSPNPGIPVGGLMIGAIPPVGSDDELMRRAEALASKADAVICVVGTSPEWETEGHDRAIMDLPGLQNHLVQRLTVANPRTCVLVNAGSPVTMGWAADVPAVAQIWFGGEQVGEGVADVLLGDADPGGRLPMTIPHRLSDTPAFKYYPGADGHAPYGEGLLIGYRHYDTNGVEPHFAFGHGLSYTTFELGSLETDVVAPLRSSAGQPLPPGLDGEPIVSVSATVTNAGNRAGTEVVQCYVSDLGHHDGEPVQQLRAFGKVVLEPGASAQIEFRLSERDFARYDETAGGWVTAPGNYGVRFGRSSADLPLWAVVELVSPEA